MLLRDGRAVELAPYTQADARDLAAFQRALARDGRGMVLAEDEIDDDAVHTRHEEMAKRGLLTLARVDGAFAGSCDVSPIQRRMLRHVASFGLGVHPEFQGQGLGRLLTQHALDWSAEHGILRLELYVRADNVRAIRLYESVGFALESTRPDFVRLDDGGFVDDHVMVWRPA